MVLSEVNKRWEEIKKMSEEEFIKTLENMNIPGLPQSVKDNAKKVASELRAHPDRSNVVKGLKEMLYNKAKGVARGHDAQMN